MTEDIPLPTSLPVPRPRDGDPSRPCLLGVFGVPDEELLARLSIRGLLAELGASASLAISASLSSFNSAPSLPECPSPVPVFSCWPTAPMSCRPSGRFVRSDAERLAISTVWFAGWDGVKEA